jgi:hypothetical protein
VDSDPPAVDFVTDLYALPPEQFIAARDEAVKQAKAAGDRRLAAEIGKLRRPTVAAWVVNRLAQERSEMVEELLDLGEALRSAQRNLRGDELRELSLQRRALVSAMAREAVVLARREHRRDNLPVAEVEATLTAALADPEVAEMVRTGQLTRTVEYTGFGETPRPRLRLLQGGSADPEIDVGRSNAVTSAPSGRDRPTSTKERGDRDAGSRARAHREAAEREAAEREAAEREAAEREAAEREAAERAEKERREAERREAERAAAAELRRARATAHRELLAARTELADAEAARALAERAVLAARRRVEKATAVLTALQGPDDEIDDPG